MTFETIENWALHAFADGELEGEERLAMEKLLAENDEARKALAAINYQKSELRKAFGDVVDEPVPQALLGTAQKFSTRRRWPYAAMAASVALLVLGGTAGWFSALQSVTAQNVNLANRATVAHFAYAAEKRHMVEVPASDKEHLQAWLSKRVGTDFVIPDLVAAGFPLLGGRLLADENSPAGQLMYEAADKRRLTIFVAANPSGKDEPEQWTWKDKLVTCFWREGKLALAVTGEMSDEEMTGLAKSIYDQMEKKS